MKNEEFKSLTDEEFEEYLRLVKADFPRHYRKLEEIKIRTVLTPKEAIEIAKKYHDKNELDGEINTLIVSDRDKTVMDMLDLNGHPVSEGNEFTDEEIAYIKSEEDPEEDND